jgi:hypothetical protein
LQILSTTAVDFFSKLYEIKMGKIKLEHDVGSTHQQIQRLKVLRFSIKKPAFSNFYFHYLCDGFHAKIHCGHQFPIYSAMIEGKMFIL